MGLKKVLVGLAVVVLMTTQAHALSTSDVTLGGNDADAAVVYKKGMENGLDLIGKDRNNHGGNGADITTTINGITYTFVITSVFEPKHEEAYGTWNLFWQGNDNALLVDFVMFVGGQGDDAVYFFNNVELAAGPADYLDNSFTVTIGNNGTQYNWMELYVANVRPIVNPIPEPTTMLLFGTGLLGLAAVSRRKRS